MKLEDLAKNIANCDYEHLPDEIELPAHIRYQLRHLAVQSKEHGQETSATLVTDSSKTDDALSLTGASRGHEGHASIHTRDVQGSLQFVGTFHTHLASTASITATSESVREFAQYVIMHDGSKAIVKNNKASKTTSPLTYSTTDVTTFVTPREHLGREHFSFLFCLPATLYMLVWAKDSNVEGRDVLRDLSGHAFEEIFLDVVRQTFGATPQDAIDLNMDKFGPLFAHQCLPLTTIIGAGQSYRFGVYHAHVPLEGLDEAAFKSSEKSVHAATHEVIPLKRFKP